MLTWETTVEAQALYARGWTKSAIARHLGINRRTVREYLKGQQVPGQRVRSEPEVFAPFAEYARLRLADDPRLWASTLFDELTALGYAGSYPSFTRALRTRKLRPHCEPCAASRSRAYSANGANTSGSDRTRWPGTGCPFRYSRTVRRLIPRCRAIADFVQPRAYSACASTVVSHVSIPTGSFDGSGGQRPRASREPTDIRWTPVGGSLKVGRFSEQLWVDSDERHQHRRGFTGIHPSSLPLACDPRTERGSLGFP